LSTKWEGHLCIRGVKLRGVSSSRRSTINAAFAADVISSVEEESLFKKSGDFKYRLDPLLHQKTQVKQQAEQSLAERSRELTEEERRLAEVQQHEAELLSLKERSRNELLHTGSAKQLTGEEVRQRLNYLRGVDQDVESARGEVFAQKQVVDESQVKLIQARQFLADCAREVEVLEKHRNKQEVRHHNELERKESHELDEAATHLFISKRKLT